MKKPVDNQNANHNNANPLAGRHLVYDSEPKHESDAPTRAIQSVIDKLSRENEALKKANGELIEANIRLQFTKKDQDIRQAQANLNAMVENFDGYVWSIDRSHRYLVLNSRLRNTIKDIYGMDVNPGDSVQDVLNSSDPSQILNWETLYKESFAGKAQRLVHEFSHEGEVLYFDMSINPIYDGSSVIGVTCFARDITLEKIQENKLHSNETRFEVLIEKSHNGIALFGADSKISYVSPSVSNILGYTRDELLVTHPAVLYHPDDVQAINAVLNDLQTLYGETRQLTYRLRHKNGEWRWISSIVTNMLREPLINAFVLNYRDVTEEFKAEENLKKATIQRTAILNSLTARIALLDEKGNIIDVNEAWSKSSDQNELTGNCYTESINYIVVAEKAKLLSPQAGKKIAAAIRDVIAGRIDQFVLEYACKTPSGQKWFYLIVRPVFGINSGAVVSHFDITEIKIAEQIIRNSEQLYRSLFNDSPIAKWVVDRKNLGYLEVNDMAVSHYGYSREEFLQMTAFDLRLPDNRKELEVIRQNRKCNDFKNRLVTHVKKNGETLIAEVFVHPIIYKDTDAYLVIAHDISRTLQLQDELTKEKVNRQIDITKATIEAQEKERGELGKELHDNVNQMLATARLCLSAYQTNPQKDETILRKSINVIDDSIEELRKISKSLVPPSLGDFTLTESIEQLVENIKFANMEPRLQLSSILEHKLSEALKISIYRIIQEQLNNILKYSKASVVEIVIQQNAERLELKISDNGIGFDLNQKRAGIGLTNIINRATTFNGKVLLDSEPGRGCTINASFLL
ncbi:sensor histidine kinase [Flavitalea sp.]|nr:PAS domain S-box protein [Flavitalea sp.]